MSDFLDNLGSPSWWIGVVVVGIIINLVSAYVKPRLDSWIATFSAKRRQRLDRQQEKRDRFIALLASDDREFAWIALSEVRHRLRAVMGLLFRYSPFFSHRSRER